jgi:dTDP-4-amino-4,6-dideoxygalactose transaminase
MKIPWADISVGQGEKKAVAAVFDSRWLSMGPLTRSFEAKIGSFIGVKHAIAVSNGTVALDLALKALGIGPGDEVIVPAMTYAATVSAVLYQYAAPVFADIETDTFNIDPASVIKRITGKTKCIIYIDYGGMPARSRELEKIARARGIPLLQDGAQSFGARAHGENLCKQGAISTTSFNFAKLISTVEGGMVFTDDDELAGDVRMRRNQGESPDKKYVHEVLGTNARLTDLQAAIGLKQFARFGAILKKREYAAAYYYGAFAENGHIRLPVIAKGCRPSWFFAPILVESRDRVARALSAKGIAFRIAYPMPVYEQPFFRRFRKRGQPDDCPRAKWVTRRILNLPLFHEITDKQLSYVVEQTIRIVNSI